jgi:DNA-binding NarL/FixJ family response regulator
MNVLILDDEEMIRESLAVYFETRGASVFKAGSAEEALEILAGTGLDAAVVDIRLPGMNGNEFLRRASEQRPGMRFVVHTGSVDYTIPGEVLAAGVRLAAVFQKPVYDLADIYDAAVGTA